MPSIVNTCGFGSKFGKKSDMLQRLGRSPPSSHTAQSQYVTVAAKTVLRLIVTYPVASLGGPPRLTPSRGGHPN